MFTAQFSSDTLAQNANAIKIKLIARFTDGDFVLSLSSAIVVIDDLLLELAVK